MGNRYPLIHFFVVRSVGWLVHFILGTSFPIIIGKGNFMVPAAIVIFEFGPPSCLSASLILITALVVHTAGVIAASFRLSRWRGGL